ncbi:uncharacterized protein FOMMEDRAFT_151591 [Fomitiporia mediterranea MF3/22]|uniref:uncharacterized protein n=1 Tax=Fomitiporia mediterranea (strain MF3/22) TaxID=694068 RepID=UPI00044085AC|nr:uncharacterized protein FOMMEDRAFT_151591 [Fomitiporia mediterranea MF3/22]EJD06351.1 hypothetical protein FOMMEDRAFT_151591 [Fomitiporia mediterranea MF3/22]
MPNDFFNNSMHSRTSSRSAAQTTTMSTRLRQCPCTATPVVPLSLTRYALSFSTRSVLETTLDMPTPRAFAFLCARHGIALNGSIDPPLTPPAPSLSATSTLPSLFMSGRPRDTPSRSMTQHTVPSIACCSKSMQHACTDTDSPVAQISSLDAPDLNPVHYLPFLHVVMVKTGLIYSKYDSPQLDAPFLSFSLFVSA